jgi:hypothetical protein
MYSANDPDGLLVCVLSGTEVFIEQVKLRPEAACLWRYEAHLGKTNVKAMFLQASPYTMADCVHLDGTNISINYLEIGTRINIGIPFERDLVKALELDTPGVDIALERYEPINEVNEDEANRIRARREHVDGD